MCIVNHFIISFKNNNMKLPKALLAAIVLGITLQATSSCGKDKEVVGSQTTKEAEKENPKPVPDPCPACGMG
jgi:hypothetical protein